MTVSSLVRKAGPFMGNSAATVFPFNFKVFTKDDVKVLLVNPTGVSTTLVLDSDYSVALSADQNAAPGGSITYPISAGVAPLPTSYSLVMLGDLPYDQQTDITNGGGFYPSVIGDALDRATIQIQQLAEITSRAVVIPEDENASPVLPSAPARANTVMGFDALGDVTTMPLPASVGAGDLKNESWTAGTDFVAGTSTSVTLSRAYANKANLGTVVMQGIAQDPNSYSLNGVTLQFDSVIPLGTNRIWCVGGTTLSVFLPPNSSVGDAQLQWGRILKRVVASVAAMASLNVAVYQEAFATDFGLGYGGGGNYSYNATMPQTSANGGTVVASAGGTGCWVLQKGAHVTIETFGAAADGSDAGPAINAAIASGETAVNTSRGQYTINTPLNFTNRNSAPLIFRGAGAYFQQNTGTTFLFKTGTWMADMTGCQFMRLEDMRWYSDGTAGCSTMGVLYARSTTVGYAMYNRMASMIIELPSSSGSAAGSVALANNCAENFQCDQCWFLADTPYVGSLGNEVGFASVYSTIANTIFSNTDKTFRQCIFQARNGYANLFYGEADCTFDQCNWTTFGALGAGVLAAMSLNASADAYQKCSNLRFTGDVESFPSIAYLAGNTQNIDIDVTTANTTYSFVQPYSATTHDNFKLKVNQLSGVQTNLVLSVGAGVVMNNAEIWMSLGQTILDGNLTIHGGAIYGGGNDLSNTGVLSINSASSFRASYINSTLRGSAAWTPGGITNGGRVSTTVAVPNAIGGTNVRVFVPYPLQGCSVSADVSASNTVEIVVTNNTGATVALGAGTWVVEVNKLYA